MNRDKESKKITDLVSGEVNHPLLPKITSDEVDLEIDTAAMMRLSKINHHTTINP